MSTATKLDALTTAVFETLAETAGRSYRDDAKRAHFQRALTQTFTSLADSFPDRSPELWELFDQALLKDAAPLLAACLYDDGVESARELVRLWADRLGLVGEQRTKHETALLPMATEFLRRLTGELQTPGIGKKARLTDRSQKELLDALTQAGQRAAAIGTAQGFQLGDRNFQQNIFYDPAYVAYLQHEVAERERKAAEQAHKLWQRTVESLLAIAPPWPDALPCLAEVDPYGAVGVSKTKYANQADPYVTRDKDIQLDHCLATDPFVLVIGDSKAGKSRTAFEAATRVFPTARLIVPRGQPGTLGALFGLDPSLVLGPGPIVLWLDDLERYLSGSGDDLDVTLLDRLIGSQSQVVVVATMRSMSRARVLNAVGELARTARQVLDRATTIELATTLSEPERADAVRLYPTENFQRGIGEQLVAAPLLEQKYHDGREATPAGWALVQATIDWRRVGIYGPIRDSDLRDLYGDYLPSYLDSTEQLYRDGLAWAREPVASEVALLMLAERHPEPSFIPFDYIVAHADGEGGHPAVDIPERTWNFAIAKADPQDLFQVGQAAKTRDHNQTAIAAFTRAANSSQLPKLQAGLAALYVGILLQEANPTQAEQYWRMAADAGHPLAAWVLSSRLQTHDRAQAEHYLQQAADADMGDAALQLGLLLQDRDPALAEHYFHKTADDAGAEDNDVITALLHLGLLLRDRDPIAAERYLQKATDAAANSAREFSSFGWPPQDRDPAPAEHDLREAADNADATDDDATNAAILLGLLLRDRDPALAEHYLQKAADAGDDEWSTAALHLSVWLRDRDPALAEHYLQKATEALDRVGAMEVSVKGDHITVTQKWFDRNPDPAVHEQNLREAADEGNAAAALQLGQLLRKRNPAQSEHYLRRAANEGDDPIAFVDLGWLLEEKGNGEQAEHWYRKAERIYRKAENAGMPDARTMFILGWLQTKLEPRDVEGARRWYKRAADAGQTDAMYNLGLLLEKLEPPDVEGARRWYQQAADAGHTDAMYNLGLLLEKLEPPDVEGARRWYQQAADAGHTDAMFMLGLLQDKLEPPDVEGARRWYQRAADAGQTDAMYILGLLLEELEPPDVEGARRWYQQAADAGQPDAMYSLGLLLEELELPDVEGARRWYQQAADAGNTDAMNSLGWLLGRLKPPDVEGARRWYQQAADAGHTEGMVNLAPVLAVEGDLGGCRVLLLKAADASRTAARDYASALSDDHTVRDAACANLRRADDDTDAWNFLGVAALRAGDRDEARALWIRSRDANDGVAPLLLEICGLA